MVSQAIEAPAETQVDPEVPTTETETTEAPAPDSAAPETEPAATDAAQVQITEPEKPDYMTRADWEREKAEVEARTRADTVESERRRRQTENARAAKQEADQRAADQEAVDTLKAALGARGIYEVPDDAAIAAINRIASKKAERLASNSLDTVDQAWDYLTAPAYGKNVDLDDSFEDAAKRLGPKVQHLVNTIRPAIEAEARKGYIAEADLLKRIEDAIAAREAKGRNGKEELKRVDGTPSTLDRSHQATIDRVARGQGDQQDLDYSAQYVARIRNR